MFETAASTDWATDPDAPAQKTVASKFGGSERIRTSNLQILDLPPLPIGLRSRSFSINYFFRHSSPASKSFCSYLETIRKDTDFILLTVSRSHEHAARRRAANKNRDLTCDLRSGAGEGPTRASRTLEEGLDARDDRPIDRYRLQALGLRDLGPRARKSPSARPSEGLKLLLASFTASQQLSLASPQTIRPPRYRPSKPI